MKRFSSSQLASQIGETVLVKGWLHNLRSLGKIAFLILRDKDGLVQIVLEDKDQIKDIKRYQPGTTMKIVGKVQESNSEMGVEIISPEIEIITEVFEAAPIDITKEELNADMETIIEHRPISLRHPKQQAIFKIQATLVRAYREFLTEEGFTEFFGPNIIGASSEGGSELFTVNYFDNQAMLSQSAQLYKQMMVGVYEKVFALMKCFRAEKSNTRRHLTEATQFEFEMGFIEDFSEVMDMLEKVVKHLISTVQSECKKEIEILGAELPLAPEDVRFPRIKFRDALELYYKRTGIDERGENDLSPNAEKELCRYAREEYGTDFILITHFLRTKVAFYAKPNEEDPTVANYFDLLCREAEIVSGGQRIHNHDELVESLKLKGMNPKSFTDYLSIFKYGMPPHGGFGMGMERLTTMVVGAENIREATLFPSDTKRVAGVTLKKKSIVGAENIRDEIVKKLDSSEVQYKHLEHEETPKSEDSAKARGTKVGEGVKSLILKSKKTAEYFQVNIPADKRVNIKAVEKQLNEKLEMAKPDEIKDSFGLQIGGVPPFGNLYNLKNLFDNSIREKELWAFNCGLRTESIIIEDSSDWLELAEPIWGNFAKE